MKASVIICTYNRADSLKTALECLEWQTAPDFEVIVVNGPSTDHTEAILTEYQGRIKVLHNPEKNYIISRNMGLQIASGEIVSYIDDDSEPDTHWLENVLQEFVNPQVGAVSGPTYDTTGARIEWYAWLCTRQANTGSVNKLFPFFCQPGADPFPYTHGCNMSLRRCVLQKVGGFLEPLVFYYEEAELCRRFVDVGFTIVNSERCAMLHRTIKTANTDNIRTHRKGLLHPYHALKNSVYLLYQWADKNSDDEELAMLARQKADCIYAEGKKKYAEGMLTRREWATYRDEIGPALEWGVEYGKKNCFSPPSVSSAIPEHFLPFPTRRNPHALTVCLLLWSLTEVASGVVRAYIALAHSLAERGHEVHLIGPMEHEVRREFNNNVHFHYVDITQQDIIWSAAGAEGFVNNAYSYYKKVSELQKTRVVDIVMGFIFCSTPLFCAMDPQLHTILTLCTTQKTWCKAHPHWKNTTNEALMALEALVLQSVTHIHSLSHFITQGVQQDYPEHMREDAQLFTVPIGVDGPAVCPLPRPADGRIRILFTGRLEGRKGPDVLLSAVAKLMGKYDNLELYLAGNDTLTAPTGRTYRQDFEAQYTGTAIGRRVYFLGFVPDEELYRQYALCDIYCSPSLSESFGIIFAEAMAYGKPVIGCRAGGMPEVITEGETGLLAEPGDVASLVSCLEKLITDAPLRKRMGEAARKRYESSFTLQHYAESMEKEFYRITGKGPVVMVEENC